VAKPPPHRAAPAAPRLTLRIVAIAALVALVAAGAVAGWAEWRLRRPAAAGGGAGEPEASARAQGTGEDALLRTVQRVALAGGAAALLLGLAAAPLAARRARRPWREVTAAAEAARAGDLAGAARHAVPGALAALLAELEEQRALAAAVAAVGREGRSAPGQRPAERHRGSVLVVEMARYGRSGPDAEPREVAERLSRDLARVRRAVTARGGRVEGALGHRVLAAFAGDGSTARAAAAAAELLSALAAPENAFDEPVPPALALATGELVLGGPDGARTVAGLPVQQAEGLLREAAAGDLVLGQAAYRELEGALVAIGLQVAPQRGLLSPQPVYLLDAERAARAAAALGSGREAAGPGLDELAPGAVVADRFVLAERLAAGPAATVFAARDRETDGPVAIKLLRRERAAGRDRPEAFDDDSRRALRVVHPAVARVVEMGVAGGVPFVASEWVDGPSLARVLAGERALPTPAALRLARGLAAGLEAIHAAGLAHGDVRPENLFLDPRGHARLIDLGWASLRASLPDPGSRRYLAPERLAGGPPSAAADVWAAGALLAEAFTGRSPYGQGAGGEAAAAGPPVLPDPTELPDGLAPVLARCLEPAPEARYADGGELAAALAPIRAALVRG
jgi:class 3 adenylate cyclase